MSRLRICLLGSPVVELNGRPMGPFATDKTRALFYYLAAENAHPHRREVLAGLLWADQPEERARQNLRQTLTYLRQSLGEDEEGAASFLSVTRGDVQLALAADDELDVAVFAERIQESQRHRHRRLAACPPCLERLRQAVDLYRGDFLAGFFLGDSTAFEEWAMLKREWLRREAVAALGILADYHERRGEYEPARAYAQRQVQLEPWREEAHRQLMRLWAGMGQRSAALAQYEMCRRALAEELAAEPMPETRELGERIRAAQEPLPAAPRNNLPPAATVFVGRAREVAELSEMLADPDCRLITLVGMGGVGKTRLALQVAAAARGGFAHGVYLAALSGVSSPEAIVPAVVDALGLALAGRESPREQLLGYLRRHELLLVLDNLEHLLAAADLLAAILRDAPGVVLLVTSRERLNLQEEWVYEVGGLEPASAVDLFADRARRVRRTFALAAERPHVEQICRLVEGVPLAVELAAAGSAQRSCAETATALAAGLDVLRTAISNIPARHRSMAATFEYSWGLLSAAERATFARLSVFRGGFDRAAADQVAAAPADVLAALVDKSFLQCGPSGRFQPHELLRHFAAARLADTPEEVTSVRDRHSCCYAGRLAEWEAHLCGSDPGAALEALKADLENVQEAWHWAVAGGRLEDLADGSGGLTRFYLRRGPFEEGEGLLREAIAAVRARVATAGPTVTTGTLLARLLGEQGRLLGAQARHDQAIAVAQEAVAVVHFLPGAGTDPPLLAVEALGQLLWGQSLLSRSGATAARPHVEESLALARTGRLSQLEADCLRTMGTLAVMESNYERARDDFARALSIYRAIGDSQGEGQTLNNLGLASWEQGDLDAAQQCLEQSLQIKRRLGDWQGEGHAHINLGILRSNRGEYAEAQSHLGRALQFFRELGNRQGEAQALSNLGVVLRACALYSRARTCFDMSLQIDREIGHRRSEGIVLSNLGLLCHLLGDQEAACNYSAQAAKVARQSHDRRLEGYALTHQGHALLALGQVEPAAEAYQQALALRRAVGQEHLAAESQAGLARAYLAAGRPAAALPHGEEILAYLESHGLDGTEEPLRIYWVCWQTLRANGDPRADAVRHATRRMLEERAARIRDAALRKSFLENVAVHREIRGLAPT